MFEQKIFDKRANTIVEWLEKEYTVIRTGQATPALLDSIQVESFGAKVPINQIGSVGVENARTLRISVWDTGNIRQIDQAIVDADLGVSVTTDDSGLRVIFPELTGERRTQLSKIAKSKLEEARVSIRNARDDAMKSIDKDTDMSDDKKFAVKEELQKAVDLKNRVFDELLTKKEVEISN